MLRKNQLLKNQLLLVLLTICMISNASAAMLGFGCVSNNNVSNCATGETQLSVSVTDEGSNQVLFTFNNTGPLNSSIADVYFDDNNGLLSIAALIDADENSGDMGVDFSVGASPPNLPSGMTASPAFNVTSGLSADSDAPTQPNGVNPGEALGILLTIATMENFNSVITDLASGDLRVGIHVQGFSNGGSESLVSTPVPLPAAVWMMGAGLMGLLSVGRRKLRA